MKSYAKEKKNSCFCLQRIVFLIFNVIHDVIAMCVSLELFKCEFNDSNIYTVNFLLL